MKAHGCVSDACWEAVKKIPSKDLLLLARGHVDARRLMKEAVASRGIGKKGEWAGSEQASKSWGVA